MKLDGRRYPFLSPQHYTKIDYKVKVCTPISICKLSVNCSHYTLRFEVYYNGNIVHTGSSCRGGL
jgi:hypothetical protein